MRAGEDWAKANLARTEEAERAAPALAAWRRKRRREDMEFSWGMDPGYSKRLPGGALGYFAAWGSPRGVGFGQGSLRQAQGRLFDYGMPSLREDIPALRMTGVGLVADEFTRTL